MVKFSVQLSAALIVLLFQIAIGQRTNKVPLADPAKLLDAIDKADKLVVYDTSVSNVERQIYTSSDRKDLSALKAAIMIEPPQEWFRCACLPSTVIRLYRRNKKVDDIDIFEGVTVRFSTWPSDARISNTKLWFEWLEQRGILGPGREFEAELAREQEDQAAEERWMKAMPSSLRPLWATAASSYPMREYDTTTLDVELSKEFPDRRTRILRLMAWFGSGAGPWSGYPAYENVAEQMLLKYPTTELLAAVAGTHLNEEEIEGAARLFAGWDFNKSRPKDNSLIPDDLKRDLLEHSLKSLDKDKLARAKHAFENAKP